MKSDLGTSGETVEIASTMIVNLLALYGPGNKHLGSLKRRSTMPGQTTHHDTNASHMEKKTSRRGFASMDKEKQREIASKGGKAAHAAGTAHEFDSREAAEAGRKGGEAVSRDRAHMAEIGGKGGRSRGRSAAAAGAQTSSAETSQPPSTSTGSSLTPSSPEEPKSEH